jgi:hypothetical protein
MESEKQSLTSQTQTSNSPDTNEENSAVANLFIRHWPKLAAVLTILFVIWRSLSEFKARMLLHFIMMGIGSLISMAISLFVLMSILRFLVSFVRKSWDEAAKMDKEEKRN